MEKISLNLHPDTDWDVNNQLQQAINDLGPGGEINITLKSSEASQTDTIISLLRENGFDYQTKGSDDGKSLYINARRKVH
ncbi:hypothetical protein [Desulfofalx alkaliphila]|uniref:hypothetical protein n=1 Tax=Desulfofalx alkaliphila TaxID=105483 RepID=UPI0004E1260F|nr:hypothetical protein [Desulfofalx alkaliphila]